MGILNVTPDSFSDGGRFARWQDAVEAAHRMIDEGADIIDVGGESTRPSSVRIDSSEEQRRIMDVVAQLAADGIRVSVDTIHADTAAKAVDAGAQIINDISGGMYDPMMASTMAGCSALYICQHWRGTPDVMDTLTDYPDGVVAGVVQELRGQMERLEAAGVDKSRIIADPGLGFAKTSEQSWELLRNFDVISDQLGTPILIGQSRKRFLADTCMGNWEMYRDDATAAVSMWCASKGAWALRVHNVGATAVTIRTIGHLRAE